MKKENIKHGNTRHGMIGTREYRTWKSMRGRCNNPFDQSYANYGGRGIKVCKRWDKFENFYSDMGPKPEGMTLDRTRNNGDYKPSNCRWATWKEQARNKRNNLFIKFKGSILVAAEIDRIMGFCRGTIWARVIRHGWSHEEAINTPIGKRRA